jgi:hypothetical protein
MSVSWLVVHPRWDLIATCLLHSGLVCVLLSWTLIRYDGHRLPRRYVAFVFVVALLLTALAAGLSSPHAPRADKLAAVPEPHVQPVPGQAWEAWQTGWAAAGQGLVGALGGLAVGLIVAAGCRLAGRDAGSPEAPPTDDLCETAPAESSRQVSRRVQGADALAALGLAGACLGWPAALSVGLLGSSARLFGALTLGVSPLHRKVPLLAYASLAALLQICLWRWLDRLAFWPSDAAGTLTQAVAATIVLVLAWQASVLERLAARLTR